ncbi:MAG: hypothetical protein C0594_14630 [Marinilabiliales bacterium]|nr:MAG: hypothetical protein C0594_14630 [Marinilabiliales bacterium]
MRKLSITILTVLFAFTAFAQEGNLVESGMQKAGSGDYKGAIEDYTKAISKDPEDLNAYLKRAFAYGIVKEYDKAVADYSKVIKSNPDHALSYLSRGSAYNKLKKYEKALADFDKVLSIDEENQEAYNNRGWAKHYMGDKEGACKDWKKSKKLGNAEAKLILKNQKCK